MSCLISWFFFFQAEDGIRDLVRSRGLGDVYKRQKEQFARAFAAGWIDACNPHDLDRVLTQYVNDFETVSYTHLTLPTSDLV